MSKTEYWQQHINAWQNSELSQTAYCASHNIKVYNLSYWRKRLKSASSNKLIPVEVPTPKTARLVLGSQVSIELPTDHVADVLVSLTDRGLLHATS